MFVYPTWVSTLPAILKGWLERVMVPGVGFRFNEAGRVVPGLTHVRRIVGISTYGAPPPGVWLANDNGRRTLVRAMRLSTGVRTRSRWLALYSIDATHSGRSGGVPRLGRGSDGRAVKAFVVAFHPSRESLHAAVLDRVLAGLRAGGAQVRLADLAG